MECWIRLIEVMNSSSPKPRHDDEKTIAWTREDQERMQHECQFTLSPVMCWQRFMAYPSIAAEELPSHEWPVQFQHLTLEWIKQVLCSSYEVDKFLIELFQHPELFEQWGALLVFSPTPTLASSNEPDHDHNAGESMGTNHVSGTNPIDLQYDCFQVLEKMSSYGT